MTRTETAGWQKEPKPEFLHAYEPGWWENRFPLAVYNLIALSVHRGYTPLKELEGIKSLPTGRWWAKCYYLPEWAAVNTKAQPLENKPISQYILQKSREWKKPFHLARVKYELVQQGYREQDIDSSVMFLVRQRLLRLHVERRGRHVYGIAEDAQKKLDSVLSDNAKKTT